MSYRILFDGTGSSELTQLLHAVEKQLNGHSIGLMARADAPANTGTPIDAPAPANTGAPIEVPASDVQIVDSEYLLCPPTKIPVNPPCVHVKLVKGAHEPIMPVGVFIGGVVIGVVVAFILCRLNKR